MHGNRPVTQHRFRPRRGDRNVVTCLAQRDVSVFIFLDILVGLPAFERVLEMPHMTVDFDILDFEIRDRSFKLGVPVDEALSSIDQAFTVKLDENLEHGSAQSIIHGEALARPVTGLAQTALLTGNHATRFSLPVPNAFEEFFTPHCAPVRLLVVHELAFDNHLRCNTGMVGSRLPECITTSHPLKPDQDILQGVVEGMPHVQRAGNIRGRKHDRIRLGGFPARLARGECTGLFPGRVNPFFKI